VPFGLFVIGSFNWSDPDENLVPLAASLLPNDDGDQLPG
jgi:hypothetical protein